MLIQATNQGTVEWPDQVADAFGTLRALKCDKLQPSDDAIVIVTATSEDVLVFVGAFITWHIENDQCFESASADPKQWLKQRAECVAQFDRHLCAAATDLGNGFYGDLVRTVEFLDNEPLAEVLSDHINCAVQNGDMQTIDSICDALVG